MVMSPLRVSVIARQCGSWKHIEELKGGEQSLNGSHVVLTACCLLTSLHPGQILRQMLRQMLRQEPVKFIVGTYMDTLPRNLD
jgi:hypothetical protein